MGDEEETLFLRKATGLVRAWSSFDAFIYAFFSVNIITLGLFGYSYACYMPTGNIVNAIFVSTFFVGFEVVTYAMLISAMPRAGGDYIWQTRIIGGLPGFVTSLNGWVICLWLWAPIYGNMVQTQIVAPLLGSVGYNTGSTALLDGAVWWTGTTGIFLGTVITVVYVSIIVALGMKWYARIQKISFFICLAGLLTFLVGTYMMNIGVAETSFNNLAQAFGYPTPTAYADTIDIANTTLNSWYGLSSFTPFENTMFDFAASAPIIPLVAFYNLWPNWGATLYGEVKGASEYKRNLNQMMTANILGGAGAILMLGSIFMTFGYNFFQGSNFVYWNWYLGYDPTAAPLPIFPYRPMLVAAYFNNVIFSVWLIISMSFWFWGWAGTLFLSSTRCMFAMAFDRTLPSWIGQVSTRFGAPVNTIIVMGVGSLGLAIPYSYLPGFSAIFLDAVLAIAVMYFFTSIAAIILPWRKKELYKASPISKYKVGGVPLISLISTVTAGFLFYLLFMWLIDPGNLYAVSYRNLYSLLFLVGCYVGSAILYLIMKSYRRRQGIDIDKIYGEIPAE
ncbi:MAG: APC family permease [Promethearchaeota archaeon]